MSSSEQMLPSVDTGLYRHSKSGKIYELIGVALHTETDEVLVVYRPCYDSPHEYFVRPHDMFFESIELHGSYVPRFQKIDAPQSFVA